MDNSVNKFMTIEILEFEDMRSEIRRLKALAFKSQAREGFYRSRLQQLQFVEDFGCCTGDCPHEESRLCAEALTKELKHISMFALASFREESVLNMRVEK